MTQRMNDRTSDRMKGRSDENFLVFLIDTLREKLGSDVLSEEKADEIKRAVMRDYGGDSPYICKIDPERSRKVLKAFNGRNRDGVCKRYGISRSQFYSILKGRERE